MASWFVAEVAEKTVIIDDRLRFVFFGLECALGVALRPLEIERVFRESRESESAKEYVFHESQRLRILGRVDEYEGAELVIRVEGRGAQGVLPRVVEGAEATFVRLQRSREGEGNT